MPRSDTDLPAFDFGAPLARETLLALADDLAAALEGDAQPPNRLELLQRLFGRETCRRLGVIPTSTTNFLWLYGSVYLRSFGRELTLDAIPFKPWLDAGIPVVQSTDGKPYQPMFAFWQMLARRDGLTGETLSTPKQRLSRAEALRMYTMNGANVMFWENDLGSLEPGKLADLVVLSQDIMTIPEDRIPETQVLATLVGGRPVHDVGVLGS